MDFPSGSDSKASAYNVGDLGLIPGLGRSPGEENGNPLQHSSLENPHGQRNLTGYGPWGHKKSDMTDQLKLSQVGWHQPSPADSALPCLEMSSLASACPPSPVMPLKAQSLFLGYLVIHRYQCIVCSR